MDLPTLREDRIEILAHRDSGELRACPRGVPDHKVYAVYVAGA